MNTHSPQDHFNSARQYQEYYDSALREVGVRMPSPVLGQSVNEYRRKTLQALQRTLIPRNHEFSNINFREMPGDALQVFEPQFVQACKSERVNPGNYPPGQIKPIKVLDEYGRVKETYFIGGRNPNGEQTCFTQDLGRPGRRVVSFSDTSTGRVWDAIKGSWR